MKEAIYKEINRVISTLESSDKLDEAGYTDILSEIIDNPTVLMHVMNKYDLVWRDDADEYNKHVVMWNKLLKQAETDDNAPEIVVKALFNHIIDMTRCRPVGDAQKKLSDEPVKKFSKTLYDIDSHGDGDTPQKKYDENTEKRVDIAAEPYSEYGKSNVDLSKSDDNWISIRRGTRKPKIGVDVLIAGWRYAGVVEVVVGHRTATKDWFIKDSMQDIRTPDFTPLMWRDLPSVPEDIMDEVP